MLRFLLSLFRRRPEPFDEAFHNLAYGDVPAVPNRAGVVRAGTDPAGRRIARNNHQLGEGS